MLRPRFAGPVVVVETLLLLGGCAPAAPVAAGQEPASARWNPVPSPAVPPHARSTARTTVHPVTLAAAGDIACRPPFKVTARQCQQAATAAMIRRRHPDTVLALGDTQYRKARTRDYQASYDRSWGRFKGRTLPVIGNHEYLTPHAAGYFRYFGARARGPRGWYAVNRGPWRIYVLNTNCAFVACVRERRWLTQDLRTHPRRCSLAAMHHPRFSSGHVGPSAEAKRFWPTLDRHGVDLALAGHDHNYERFAPMHVDGTVAHTGIRSFIVGTGGRGRERLVEGSPRTSVRVERAYGSRFRWTDGFGVLFLTLRAERYGWSFRTTAGRVIDTGSSDCVR